MNTALNPTTRIFPVMTIHDHRAMPLADIRWDVISRVIADPEGTPPWRFMTTIKGWSIYRRGTNSYMATIDDYAAYFGALGHAEYWIRWGYTNASPPSETCWPLPHQRRTTTPWSCNNPSVE